jgi:hypothetical protein
VGAEFSLETRRFWLESLSDAGRHNLVRSLVTCPETVDCMSRSPLRRHDLRHSPNQQMK